MAALVCGAWRYPDDAEERLDVRAQEFPSCCVLAQERRGLFTRQRGAVRAMRRQRIVDVGNSHNLREKRHLGAAKSQRITAAVESFVMKTDDRPHGAQRLQW